MRINPRTIKNMRIENIVSKTILKIIVSAALLLFLLFKVNLKEVANLFLTISLPVLAILFLLTFIIFLIKAIKWGILLKSININIKLIEIYKLTLIGVFYGMITPAKIGDFLKCHHIEYSKSEVISTILWDRIIDIAVLILLSNLSVFLFFRDRPIIYIMLILTVVFTVVFLLITNQKIIALFANLLKIPEGAQKNFIDKMTEIRGNKKTILNVFAWTIWFYIVVMVISICILRSFDPRMDISIVFFVPVIILVANVPITISGLGLREYAAVLCFTAVSGDATLGFTFSITLFIATTVIPGIIGYLIHLKEDSIKRVGQSNK